MKDNQENFSVTGFFNRGDKSIIATVRDGEQNYLVNISDSSQATQTIISGYVDSLGIEDQLNIGCYEVVNRAITVNGKPQTKNVIEKGTKKQIVAITRKQLNKNEDTLIFPMTLTTEIVGQDNNDAGHTVNLVAVKGDNNKYKCYIVDQTKAQDDNPRKEAFARMVMDSMREAGVEFSSDEIEFKNGAFPPIEQNGGICSASCLECTAFLYDAKKNGNILRVIEECQSTPITLEKMAEIRFKGAKNANKDGTNSINSNIETVTAISELDPKKCFSINAKLEREQNGLLPGLFNEVFVIEDTQENREYLTTKGSLEYKDIQHSQQNLEQQQDHNNPEQLKNTIKEILESNYGSKDQVLISALIESTTEDHQLREEAALSLITEELGKNDHAWSSYVLDSLKGFLNDDIRKDIEHSVQNYNAEQQDHDNNVEQIKNIIREVLKENVNDKTTSKELIDNLLKDGIKDQQLREEAVLSVLIEELDKNDPAWSSYVLDSLKGFLNDDIREDIEDSVQKNNLEQQKNIIREILENNAGEGQSIESKELITASVQSAIQDDKSREEAVLSVIKEELGKNDNNRLYYIMNSLKDFLNNYLKKTIENFMGNHNLEGPTRRNKDSLISLLKTSSSGDISNHLDKKDERSYSVGTKNFLGSIIGRGSNRTRH